MSLPAVFAAAVDARAVLRSSVPANGATVATASARAVIAFIMEAGATRDSGADVNGTILSTGLSVDPDGRTTMAIAPTPRLGSGVYTVTYGSFSAADGRAVNGSFNFTVAPGGAGGAGAATPGKGGGTPWALLVAVLAAVAAFIVGGFFIAVRSRREYLDMEARKAAPPPDEDD